MIDLKVRLCKGINYNMFGALEGRIDHIDPDEDERPLGVEIKLENGDDYFADLMCYCSYDEVEII